MRVWVRVREKSRCSTKRKIISKRNLKKEINRLELKEKKKLESRKEKMELEELRKGEEKCKNCFIVGKRKVEKLRKGIKAYDKKEQHEK